MDCNDFFEDFPLQTIECGTNTKLNTANVLPLEKVNIINNQLSELLDNFNKTIESSGLILQLTPNKKRTLNNVYDSKESNVYDSKESNVYDSREGNDMNKLPKILYESKKKRYGLLKRDDLEYREIKGKLYVNIKPLLSYPQETAAKYIGVASSTLSKKWKTIFPDDKWPFRKIIKYLKLIDDCKNNQNDNMNKKYNSIIENLQKDCWVSFETE